MSSPTPEKIANEVFKPEELDPQGNPWPICPGCKTRHDPKVAPRRIFPNAPSTILGSQGEPWPICPHCNKRHQPPAVGASSIESCPDFKPANKKTRLMAFVTIAENDKRMAIVGVLAGIVGGLSAAVLNQILTFLITK
jgi:hypothetical protein